MLQIFGLGRTLNVALWYVSAVLVESTLIWYLECKYKEMTNFFILPVAVVLIYSFFYQDRGMLASVGLNPKIIIGQGFLRATAGFGVVPLHIT